MPDEKKKKKNKYDYLIPKTTQRSAEEDLYSIDTNRTAHALPSLADEEYNFFTSPDSPLNRSVGASIDLLDKAFSQLGEGKIGAGGINLISGGLSSLFSPISTAFDIGTEGAKEVFGEQAGESLDFLMGLPAMGFKGGSELLDKLGIGGDLGIDESGEINEAAVGLGEQLATLMAFAKVGHLLKNRYNQRKLLNKDGTPKIDKRGFNKVYDEVLKERLRNEKILKKNKDKLTYDRYIESVEKTEGKETAKVVKDFTEGKIPIEEAKTRYDEVKTKEGQTKVEKGFEETAKRRIEGEKKIDARQKIKDLEARGKITYEEAQRRLKKLDEKLSPDLKKSIIDLQDKGLKTEDILKEDLTSIKNKKVNQERIDRGLDPLETVGKREWGKVWDEAKNKVETGEVKPRDLVNELKDNPRPVTDTEAAILDYDRVTLKNRHKQLTDEIAKTKDNDLSAQHKTELLKVEEWLNENDIVSRQTGTEVARALAIRKMMVKSDYSLASILQEARTANKGEPLPPEVRSRLENLQRKIEGTEQDFLKTEEVVSETYGKQQIDKLQREIKFEERKQRRQYKKEEIDAEYSSLVNEFLKTQSLNIGFTSQQISLFGKMAKNRVKSGLNSIEGVVDEIYMSLKDKVDGLSKRDVRDAISGYGKFSPLTKDQIQLQLNDIKKQGRLISAIEDINSNKLPKSTGKERQQWSDRVKELTKQLNEAKRESGEGSTQLKAYKARLENRAKELQRMLDEKDFEKKPRRKLELDKEAEGLRENVENLKREVDKEIYKIEQKNRTLSKKITEGVIDVGNVPRNIMASTDFSAMLRQAVVLTVGHPILTFKKGGAFRNQFRYFFSEKAMKDLRNQINDSPNLQLYRDSKLYLANEDINFLKLNKREEAFMSRLAEKIPGGGQIIKASERAYTGFLDKIRMDVFDNAVKELQKGGYTFKTDPKVFKDLAKFINNASGRGSMGVSMNKIATQLATIFFSPRLIASRLQLMNPKYYKDMSAPVRKMAMKDMLSFIATGTSLLALAKLGGADVEVDPRSSDFGKIKIGELRLDILGGFQQIARYGTQILSGQTKTSGGIVRDLDGEKFPFVSRWEKGLKFLESKMSPAMGLVRDLLKNQNYKGDKLELDEKAMEMAMPLYIQDLIEASKEMGVEGAALSLPGIFGVGVQYYEKAKPATTYY